MHLEIISTGSKGNCYLLHSEKEVLVLDCGVKFHQIKKSVRFDLGLIVGVLLSHAHFDHSLATKDLIYNGVDVFASLGTFESLKIKPPKGNILKHNEMRKIGGFSVIPINVVHDVKEPLGFIINHKECGNVLFATDTSSLNYNIPNLNNIIIEANFCNEIVLKNDVEKMKFLSKRIIKTHFSIQNCLDFLTKTDLSNVNNIVLIHLSDRNSDEKRFKELVEKQTLKTVTVASNNMTLTFNKEPF